MVLSLVVEEDRNDASSRLAGKRVLGVDADDEINSMPAVASNCGEVAIFRLELGVSISGTSVKLLALLMEAAKVVAEVVAISAAAGRQL